MDSRLSEVLEALVSNVEVLNDEVERLGKCDHFAANDKTLQIIERIRGCCTNSLQNLRTAELRILTKQSRASNKP